MGWHWWGRTSIAGLFALAVRLRPTRTCCLVPRPQPGDIHRVRRRHRRSAGCFASGIGDGDRVESGSMSSLGFSRPSYLVALAAQWRLVLWGLVSAAAVVTFALIQFGFDPSEYQPRRFAFPVRRVPRRTFCLVRTGPRCSGAGHRVLRVAIPQSELGRFWSSSCFASVRWWSSFPLMPGAPPGSCPVLWAFGPAYQGPDSLIRRRGAVAGRPRRELASVGRFARSQLRRTGEEGERHETMSGAKTRMALLP